MRSNGRNDDSVALDACDEWPGTRTKAGYGLVSERGRTRLAHRVAWERENGPIPPGVLILHRCDNPPCRKVSHLFPGTHQDNSDDMVRKGRQATGLRNGHYTKPERTPRGDRNGSRTHPEKRTRGDDHWTRREAHRLQGALNPNAKLSDADVAEIVRRVAAGERQVDVALAFGVTQPHVSRLVLRKQRVPSRRDEVVA